MLVEHIQSYMIGKDRTFKQTAMDWAIEKFKKTLLRQFSEESRPRSGQALYASDATKCPRKTMYSALGIQGEPMSADVKFKLMMGDIIELALVYVSQLVPNVQLVKNNEKLKVTIGGKERSGATDGILIVPDGRKQHVEFKSASDIGFSMTMRNGIDDNFGYLGQAEVYHRQLTENKEINTPETLFVYINRDTMKLAEIQHTYTGAYAQQADESFRAIDLGLDQKRMVPRPYGLLGNKLPLQCAYCAFKFVCWTTPAQVVTFDNEGLPVYKTPPDQRLEVSFDKRGKPSWFVV